MNMSKLLRNNAPFISLLLSTPSRQQAIALLDTATPEQAKTIAEIGKNLLLLPLSAKVRLTVNKRRKLLEKLADAKISAKKKYLLISKHFRLILEVLYAAKKGLLEILNALK